MPKPTNLTQQTYQILQERIFNNQLKHGGRISIEGLANEIGVSRTPIREAASDLAKEGLLVQIRGKGYYVTTLSDIDIQQIFELRSILEIHALENIQETIEGKEYYEEDFQELKEQMEKAQIGDKPTRRIKSKFLDIDMRLHLKIIQLSQNKWIERLYHQLFKFVRMVYHRKTDLKRIRTEHLLILEEILAGNFEGAKKKLKKHIDNAAEQVKEREGNANRSSKTSKTV